MIDLTSQFRLLHQQFAVSASSDSAPSSSAGEGKSESQELKKRDQIFNSALKTLDDTIREACRDATKLTLVAVNAIHDRSCFTKMSKRNNNNNNNRRTFYTFNANSHHPFSEDIRISLELADGRLVAAASAAQQMAAAVAKTASTLKVRTDDVIYARFPDRIDYYDDCSNAADCYDGDSSEILHSSMLASSLKSKFRGFGLSHSNNTDKNENYSAIRHVTVAIQCLSQMAGEARVVLALVKDEAEKVRVQRLRFAKCGVLVNPMDHIVDENNNSDSIVEEGSRLLSLSHRPSTKSARNEKNNGNQSSAANNFFADLTTGTEGFLSNTAAFGSKVVSSNKHYLDQVVKTATEGSSSVLARSSLLSKGVSLFTGSTSAVVENVFHGVAKLATETTDKIVDNMILTNKSNNKVNHNNSQDVIETEDQIRRRGKVEAELKALTSTSMRLDSRKLSEAASKMKQDGDTFTWKKMTVATTPTVKSDNNIRNEEDDKKYYSMVEDRLGLRQEHAGLETKLKDESAQAAKEVERSIHELGRMTTMLQEQVSLQTEQLMVIETNTDESTSNVEKAQQELDKHNLDQFWSFKRILAAIICAQTLLLLVLHYIIR